METAVEGKVWTLDQVQGVVNVNVPVRMVVVKVRESIIYEGGADGGLDGILCVLMDTEQLYLELQE